MADFFIKRPILSICLSIIIVLLGTFSILRLPISEYPDIIPPSIQVTATYPGADCETVVKSIASPIEQQMSGVDGMSYMTSVNTNNGQMSMMILFEIGTEANMDQVLSYLRYGQATSQLPSEVSALGVSLRKTSGLPALVVIIFMALGVPLAFQWQPPGGTVGAGLVALIMVSSAYMAETLRAGIQAVPKGQREAAQSLGMNSLWTMVSITLPQAVRIVIPPLTNEFILLLKDTSLLSIVGFTATQVELTAFGENALTTAANPSPLLAIALVYLVITLPLTQLVAHMERRQKKAAT